MSAIAVLLSRHRPAATSAVIMPPPRSRSPSRRSAGRCCVAASAVRSCRAAAAFASVARSPSLCRVRRLAGTLPPRSPPARSRRHCAADRLAVVAPPRCSTAAASTGAAIAAAAHAPLRPPSSSHIRRRRAAMNAVECDGGVAASDTPPPRAGISHARHGPGWRALRAPRRLVAAHRRTDDRAGAHAGTPCPQRDAATSASSSAAGPRPPPSSSAARPRPSPPPTCPRRDHASASAPPPSSSPPEPSRPRLHHPRLRRDHGLHHRLLVPSPSSSATGRGLRLLIRGDDAVSVLRNGMRPLPPNPLQGRGFCVSLSATECGGLRLHDRGGMRPPCAQPRGNAAAFTSSSAVGQWCPCARPRRDATTSASTTAAGRFASTTVASRPRVNGGLRLPHPRRDAASTPPRSRRNAQRPLSSSSTAGRGLQASLLRGGTAASASLVPSSFLAPRPARPPPQTPWSPPSVAT